MCETDSCAEELSLGSTKSSQMCVRMNYSSQKYVQPELSHLKYVRLKSVKLIFGFAILVYVVAKVYRRIKYTLAPNFEANVYISPKLQTWRLMCTLSPNLEAKVNLCT